MRREELYLADIVDAADAITRFIADADAQTFAENDLLRSAVLNKLAIIGEAAARLPKEFHDRHPEIEWIDIIGFRNIVVHAYFAVDWEHCVGGGDRRCTLSSAEDRGDHRERAFGLKGRIPDPGGLGQLEIPDADYFPRPSRCDTPSSRKLAVSPPAP